MIGIARPGGPPFHGWFVRLLRALSAKGGRAPRNDDQGTAVASEGESWFPPSPDSRRV